MRSDVRWIPTGIDPAERAADSAFTWGTTWWRARYRIVTEHTAQGDVPIITALDDAPGKEYSPLSSARPKKRADAPDEEHSTPKTLTDAPSEEYGPPKKRPDYPDSPEQAYAPHIALARLDPWDEKQVLEFADRWGLLGLWQTEQWRHRTPLLAPNKNGPMGLNGEPEYSGWYVNEELRRQLGTYRHSFCEPLELFALAAEEYQKLCQRLAAADGGANEAIAMAEWAFGGVLGGYAAPRPVYDHEKKAWRFGWQCSSLLGWIYLLTFLDLVEGNGLKRCAREKCGKFFFSSRSSTRFCSAACKNRQNVQDFRQAARMRPLPSKSP